VKQNEFDPSAEGVYRDAMLEQYRECRSNRPKTEAQKKAAQAGKAPKKKRQERPQPEKQEPSVRSEKKGNKCKPKGSTSATTTPAYAEQYDFAKASGRGKPCGASHISTKYVCRLDAGERKAIVDGLVGKGATKSKLESLTDEQLSRVNNLVKEKGLTTSDAQRASSTVEKLKEKAGGKKEGGANLQDPVAAGKYADFYEAKKDLTYKAPFDTDPKVAKATLEQLKDEDSAAYTKTMSALSGKGSPSQEQLAKAGWESRQERGEAVLKSLMDNDFKDINGEEASWRQGLQLDHKRAGSTGGSDRPDNWIWISTASNQAKGGMEAAAQKRGLKGQEAEDFIRNGLVEKLRANQRMSAEQVAQKKGAGASKAVEKKKMEQAMRDNLPLMTSAQRASRINDAGGDEIKTMLKASVGEGKNPVTGRATSYRPVLTGGGAERVRKAYGTVPEMKSLMRMRWDQDLSSTDLRNIGGMLKKSTGSKKSQGDKLDELLGNFPRTTGLTAAERIEILAAAE